MQCRPPLLHLLTLFASASCSAASVLSPPVSVWSSCCRREQGRQGDEGGVPHDLERNYQRIAGAARRRTARLLHHVNKTKENKRRCLRRWSCGSRPSHRRLTHKTAARASPSFCRQHALALGIEATRVIIYYLLHIRSISIFLISNGSFSSSRLAEKSRNFK